MDESYLDTNLQNFHMQNNSSGDTRTYLVPKRQFTTGDIIEYENNVVSQGSYMNMVLLTGDQYWRIGINGSMGGFDELGVTKVRMEFQENNFALRRESPSGQVFFDNLPLNNPNGNYNVYIGAYSYDAHIDLDNFYINGIPEPATMGLLGLGSLALLKKRKENKI
jgi:hypothetical protein